MSTISKAYRSKISDCVCQGDIYRNVRYNYIDTEDNDSINVVEYEFPFAIIVSQACDVIGMDKIVMSEEGKATKFMPSVLLCPIYDKEIVKTGEYIEDAFVEHRIKLIKEHVYQKDDYKVATRDWHYRYHALEICINKETVFADSIIDFKHYFTVPMSYLINNKSNRILHLDDIYAEQITLKFANYLSRVAIP